MYLSLDDFKVGLHFVFYVCVLLQGFHVVGFKSELEKKPGFQKKKTNPPGFIGFYGFY